MKRGFHFLLVILAAALLLICSAVVIAPRFIHTDLFKQNLETLLSRKLSRDVRISGNLEFRFFPWIGFKATDLEVANADGFDLSPMVVCAMADVHLEFLPFLEKRIVFKEIVLAGTSIRLLRNRHGKTNWSDFPSMGRASLDSMGEQRFVLDRIGEVDIRNSTLTYSDALTETDFTVSNFELDRKGVVQREFRISCDLKVRGRPKGGFTALKGRWEMTGNAYVDTQKKRFAVISSNFAFPFELTGAKGRITSGDISAHLTCDTANETLVLTRAAFRVGNASASGDLHAEKLFHRPSASGRFEAASENIAALLIDLNLEDFLTVWTPPPAATVAFAYAADGHGLTIDDLTVHVQDSGLKGRLVIKDFNRPEIDAVLIADRIDVDRLFPERTPNATMGDGPLAGFEFDGWNLDLQLSAGQLSGRGVAIEDLELRARAGDGRLECRPVAFAYAGGRIQGAIDAVVLDPSMVAKAAFRFDSIPAEAIWQLAGKKSPMAARLNGEMNLISEGRRLVDLVDALSGTVRVEAPDGMVIGINKQKPEETVRLARASAVLAAYVHEEKTVQNHDDRVRSFTLDVTADGLAPAVAGTFKTHGIARISPDLHHLAVSAEEFSARFAGRGLGVVSPLDIDGSGSYDSRLGKLFIDRFSFHWLGLTGSGRLRAARLASQSQFAGRLKVNNFDPRVLASRLGYPLPRGKDPLVFQHARAEADFKFDSGNLLIDRISVVVDDTSLSGQLMLAGLPRPQIEFRLHGDRLDLDRYLSVADDGPAPRAANAGDIPPDRSGFTEQLIRGQATFDYFKIADIRMTDPDLVVGMENGSIDLRLNSAALYGGAATGDAVLDAGADPLHGSVTLHLQKVALAGLLADMFDWVPITGSGALDLALTGSGRNLTALARNLKGPARVTIANGAIHGIRAAPDSMRGKASGDAGTVEQEPFDLIEGTVALDSGMLKSTDGTLASPYIKADGTGSLNLFTDILDYAITADIRGLPRVTYTFKGPLDNILVSLDRAGFARETAKGILKTPFTLGTGTLNIGTDILEAGKDAIGEGSGPQRMGQGALNVGKGILEIGKGIIGLDGKATETVGDGATEVGRGLLDVGQGVVDTGVDVLEGLGSGLQRLFSGEKSVNPAQESSPLKK